MSIFGFRTNRKTQKQRILDLLMRNKGQWVPVHWILRLSPKIANHTARITELRNDGWQILNKTKWIKTKNGIIEKHSAYLLTTDQND